MTERLPEAFLVRMRAILGGEYAAYLRAMERKPPRALRVNTLKLTEGSLHDLADFTIFSTDIWQNIELYATAMDDNTNTEPKDEEKLVISSTIMYENRDIDHSNDAELEISSRRSEYNTNTLVVHGSKLENTSNKEENNTNMASQYVDGVVKTSKDEEYTTISIHKYHFFPDDIAIGRHPLHAAGLCYVQEPSAQIPATLLGVRPGMTALDLCAAPGGKTGQLAEAMQNTGLLIANDPVPARAEALVGNVERLGIRNAVVTRMQPDALCEKLAGLCDAVLVDAPCSGEGMFRRDGNAVRDWSVEHVRACAARQRAILGAADRALRRGGALVYSTCTFSPEENEETVAAFLNAHPDYTLLDMRRLYPHTSAGEGQFIAKLVKGGRDAHDPERFERARAEKPIPAWEAFCADTFAQAPAGEALALPDGRVLLPPNGYGALPAGLYILRAGVLAGEVRQGRFIPAHALAMAIPGEAFLRCVPLAGERLSAYLAGEAVPCDTALSGWCAATYRGYPLGWSKAVGGTLKNHLPKGLRMRG